MNASGWLSLLAFVPFLGLFAALWIMIARGTDDTNNYGAAPTKNLLGLKITAGFVLFIPILGIIAAVALPAYQDCVKRARQTQQY